MASKPQSETSKMIKRINEQIRQYTRKGLQNSAEFRKLTKEFRDLGVGHKGLEYSYLPDGTPIIKNTASNRAIIENDNKIKNFIERKDVVKVQETISRAKEYLQEGMGIKKPTTEDVRNVIESLDKTHDLIELTKNAIYSNSKYSEWVHKSENLSPSEHLELMAFMQANKQEAIQNLSETMGGDIKLEYYRGKGTI